MLDFGHLTLPHRADIQVYVRPSTVNNLQWHTWQKPRGIAFLSFIIIGGGGGGGGGFTRAASAAGGGGGGGGSSPIVRVTSLPAQFLPDILYVQVGDGGKGVGSGGGAAGSGLLSHVAIHPDSGNGINLIASSGNVASVGGGTGTGAAVGAAGAAGTVFTIGNAWAHLMGLLAIVGTGQAGAAGGAVAGAVGGAISFASLIITHGGSGGAGTTSADFAGGQHSPDNSAYFNTQRPATPPAGTTGHGSGGVQLWKPFYSFGGLGGSSSNAAAGANGGNGAIGAGGGGGGAGTTGGRGGDGGPGMVVIAAW